MKITVKVLKGDECQIEARETDTILELKQKVEKTLKIPINHQKMIQAGRPLLDTRTVASYSIKDGAKITVVLKTPDSLKDAIYKAFRKHFDERQSQKLTSDFMDDFALRLKYLSVQDIERIAYNNLLPDDQRPLVTGSQGLNLDDYFALAGPKPEPSP